MIAAVKPLRPILLSIHRGLFGVVRAPRKKALSLIPDIGYGLVLAEDPLGGITA